MSERKEAFFRILVLIVSGIVLGIWKGLIQVLSLFHWFYIIFTDKRIKKLADFCEIWNSQIYTFLRYMNFVSNQRPFPFKKLSRNRSRFS